MEVIDQLLLIHRYASYGLWCSAMGHKLRQVPVRCAFSPPAAAAEPSFQIAIDSKSAESVVGPQANYHPLGCHAVA